MTLGDLLKVYGSFCSLYVCELGGAYVAADVTPCEIPMQFLSRSVVHFYPFDNDSISVTIEDD